LPAIVSSLLVSAPVFDYRTIVRISNLTSRYGRAWRLARGVAARGSKG
jgi:hypothetical protein